MFPARVLDSGIMMSTVTLELQSIGFHKLIQFFVFGVTNEAQLGNVMLVKSNDLHKTQGEDDLPGTRAAKGRKLQVGNLVRTACARAYQSWLQNNSGSTARSRYLSAS